MQFLIYFCRIRCDEVSRYNAVERDKLFVMLFRNKQERYFILFIFSEINNYCSLPVSNIVVTEFFNFIKFNSLSYFLIACPGRCNSPFRA